MEEQRKQLSWKHKAAFIFWYPVIRIILFAGVPVMWVSERIGLLKYELHERRRGKAKAWIATQLERKGIKVVGEWSYYNHAEVAEDKINDFQAVYTEALKRFPDLQPWEICGHTQPYGLLNKEWAESVGIDEYQASQLTMPCIGCGRQDVHNFKWGNEQSHKELMGMNYHFVVRPEYCELLTGKDYICRSCEPKYTTIERRDEGGK